MTTEHGDDPAFDHSLLNKADALIRRNRTTGVAPDAEDLPMLTDVVDDDLPELTETLVMPKPAVRTGFTASSPQPVAPHLDLGEGDTTPRGPYPELSTRPPREIIDEAVGAAVAQTRAEMERAHQQALQDAVARARSDALHDARQMNQHAIQAALRQGREEAEINQWPAIQAARQDAVQNAAAAMSERLIELDAQISQSINQWLARELPPIIAGELLGLSERLKVQTAAHLRATLLPELSEQVSKVLESALRAEEND